MMTRTFPDYVAESVEVLLRSGELLYNPIENAIVAITDALAEGYPVLACGNGGSAADAMHFAAELVGRFEHHLYRPPYNVRALSADPAILTAVGNDFGFKQIFARQVQAYGRKNGVLVAISTSGRSPNVALAAAWAQRLGMYVVSLAGAAGTSWDSDVLLNVPSERPALIQQAHEVIYHFIAEQVERRLNDD
jgi:D-sedoheptulose 7-phosphate isomerase